jgi:hypothetical protein
VNYSPRTRPEQTRYGLIAEEVEQVNDAFVFYDIIEGQQMVAGVHYSRLIGPLLNEIQRLEQRVVALEWAGMTTAEKTAIVQREKRRWKALWIREREEVPGETEPLLAEAQAALDAAGDTWKPQWLAALQP